MTAIPGGDGSSDSESTGSSSSDDSETGLHVWFFKGSNDFCLVFA